MNEQDLNTVEEIKKDYKEILNVGEKFYTLLFSYHVKYYDSCKENEAELKKNKELNDINEQGRIFFEKLLNII